jgi:hypothetical protein
MTADMSKPSFSAAAPPQALRRYKYDMAVTMTAYGFAIIIGAGFVVWIAVYDHPRSWAIVPALLPVAPALYGLRAYLRFYRALDELERRIQSEAFLIAMAIVGFGSFAYGFLEEFAGFAHVPLYWILPAMIGIWGVAQPFVRRRFQ